MQYLFAFEGRVINRSTEWTGRILAASLILFTPLCAHSQERWTGSYVSRSKTFWTYTIDVNEGRVTVHGVGELDGKRRTADCRESRLSVDQAFQASCAFANDTGAPPQLFGLQARLIGNSTRMSYSDGAGGAAIIAMKKDASPIKANANPSDTSGERNAPAPSTSPAVTTRQTASKEPTISSKVERSPAHTADGSSSPAATYPSTSPPVSAAAPNADRSAEERLEAYGKEMVRRSRQGDPAAADWLMSHQQDPWRQKQIKEENEEYRRVQALGKAAYDAANEQEKRKWPQYRSREKTLIEKVFNYNTTANEDGTEQWFWMADPSDKCIVTLDGPGGVSQRQFDESTESLSEIRVNVREFSERGFRFSSDLFGDERRQIRTFSQDQRMDRLSAGWKLVFEQCPGTKSAF